MQGDGPSSITLDHGDLLVMDGSAQSEYVPRTVPGLQGPRLTSLTGGLHNTLRPVHSQVWWVVFSRRVRKVWSSKVPVGWEKGNINGLLLGDWSSFY